MPSFRHQMAVQLVRAQPRRVLNPSLQTARALMDGFARIMPIPQGIDCRPVRCGGRPAERIEPSGSDSRRTVLYLHGGGYCVGSVRTHRALAARIAAATDARVVLLDYRLAPEHPFPAALDDARAAYADLRAECGSSRLVVMGDSAGGGLTLALLLALAGGGEALPAAAVCLSPWTDLAVTGESARSGDVDDPMLRIDEVVEWGAIYAGGTDIHDPLVSPLFGDPTGLPPLLIQVGDRELLLDDSRRFAATAQAAGVDVTLQVFPELMHVWHVWAPVVPESVEAIDAIGAWVHERVAGGTTAAIPVGSAP